MNGNKIHLFIRNMYESNTHGQNQTPHSPKILSIKSIIFTSTIVSKEGKKWIEKSIGSFAMKPHDKNGLD